MADLPTDAHHIIVTGTIESDGEALAATAGALGVGVGEGEAGGEIILDPVHHAADQIEDRAAVDVECAARGLDLLVELVSSVT